MPETYDAIVVGSGISGGWAAKELCEKGLRTLVLEAGGPTDPATDYVMDVQPWQLHFRGWGDRQKLEREQNVQRRCYACNEWSGKFFVNDVDNPYVEAPGTRFDWIRGRQVGGRSITWGRQVYRWSDLDFEANARDGFGTDWPIRYADIAPWYDYVERYIGISGNPEGLSQLPDGQFLPGMPLNAAEQFVRDGLARRYGRERVLTIGRAAILTQEHRGRAACGYCGQCERGCSTFSYFNSVHVTLPAARATGKLTLRPWSVVHSVIYDARRGKASGVRVIDAQTMQPIEFNARVVFLCASALESARILLNSKSERWPNGLANSSGALGKYVMDHWMGWGAHGDVPGLEDKTTFGSRPNGTYLPRFRNVNERSPDFLRGYGYQGGGGRGGWGRGNDLPGFGRGLKEALRTPAPWTYSMSAWGECLPRETNFIALDPAVKDKWGIPALRITCAWDDNARAAMRDASVQAAEMLEAAGVRNVRQHQADNAMGLTIHEMGTARMGKDRATSVLNGWNQAWDVPNLFCTDGACMASNANQNPSITYMALTARAADHAVDLMRRRELVERREFVGAVGAVALGAGFGFRPAKLQPLGVQLYTVRSLLQSDFEGTLARVAQIGYTEVEFAGYFDHTPQQVRAILDRHHLSSPGVHIGLEPLEGDWPRAIADAKTIGHKYLIVASIEENRHRTLDDWRRIGDLFNRAGEASARQGVTLAYHNHEYEFVRLEGRLPMDVLLESSDPRYLKIEMDLGWMKKAGQDPLPYFARWPGRFPCVHVKDPAATGGDWTDIGAGTVDWPGIFAHRRQAGIQHYLVEHDFDGPGDPMAFLSASYRYLNGLNV